MSFAHGLLVLLSQVHHLLLLSANTLASLNISKDRVVTLISLNKKISLHSSSGVYTLKEKIVNVDCILKLNVVHLIDVLFLQVDSYYALTNCLERSLDAIWAQRITKQSCNGKHTS